MNVRPGGLIRYFAGLVPVRLIINLYRASRI
jgi:hypothetical protein